MRSEPEADTSLIAMVGCYRVLRTRVGEYQIWIPGALEQGPFNSLQEAVTAAGITALSESSVSFGAKADRL